MATIYKRKDSPFWWIKHANPADPKKPLQYSTGFRFKVPGETRKAREFEAQKTLAERQTHHDHARSEWNSWVPTFLESRYRDNPGSLLRYQIAWRTLRLYLQQHEITLPGQLTRKHCEDYTHWRAIPDPRNGKYAGGQNTALTELKFLGLVMEEAVLRDFATRNPCRRLGLKRSTGRIRPEYSDAELERIEAAIELEPEPRRTIFRNSYLIARYHGVRLSETYLNPLTDVELWTDVTRLDGGWCFSPKGLIRFIQKGHQATTKPLHPALIPLFHRLRDLRATETYPKPKSLAKDWFNFLTRAGIKAANPNACFHSLRVSVASRMARNGVPLRMAMEYLTHASTTVHQSYVRWRPEDVAECHKAL